MDFTSFLTTSVLMLSSFWPLGPAAETKSACCSTAAACCTECDCSQPDSPCADCCGDGNCDNCEVADCTCAGGCC